MNLINREYLWLRLETRTMCWRATITQNIRVESSFIWR